MSHIVSTDNLALPIRAKHRSTGEMGTVTAVQPTGRGTYVHVTWDNLDAVELPSSVNVQHVELDPVPELVSFYNATLAKINGRVSNATLSRQELADRMEWSTAKLRRKLNGDAVLTVRDIGNFADVLGCRMSELVA